MHSEQDRMSLAFLETISDTLLEIMESCSNDMKKCDWLGVWTELARRFAFQFNPALQPRAIIAYGCISKTATELDIKQLLRMMVKGLESHVSDMDLIEAIVMCLTRLLPLLPAPSSLHRFMFWIAISILQLEDASLYAAGLALLEQNLHTMESHSILDNGQPMEKLMMEAREPLEWQFKQLDQAVGLSFKSKFHFALVGHLIKGLRHPAPNTVARTIRLLHMLLGIAAKAEKRDKFQVTQTSAPYLAALVSVSEEVRCRCHLRYQNKFNIITTTTTTTTNTNNNNNNNSNNNNNNTNHNANNKTAPGQKTTLKSPNTGLASTTIMTQSPSNQSLAMEENNVNNSLLKAKSATTTATAITSANAQQQQPKRQRSCDLIDSSRSVILAAKASTSQPQGSIKPQQPMSMLASVNPIKYLSPNASLYSPANTTASGLLLGPSGFFNNTVINLKSNQQLQQNVSNQMKKSLSTIQNHQQPVRATPIAAATTTKPVAASAADETTCNGEQLNILLDPAVINDYPTQALLLTVLATLVRNSTDENEIRVLYLYIAEASIVFGKVFPVIHNLLDSKINHILQLSLDESILDSVQSIIQNMISSEFVTQSSSSSSSSNSVGGSGMIMMNDSSYQQQLSYLQACGFGGLWRFAQPFSTMGREKPENVELFIDCLEAMVETCLQPDNDAASTTSGSFSHSDNNTATIPSTSSSSNQTIYPMSSNGNLAAAAAAVTATSVFMSANSPNYHTSVSNFASSASMSSQTNLIAGSLSGSISMGSIHSPSDRDLFDLSDCSKLIGQFGHHQPSAGHMRNRTGGAMRRNSSPKNKF